jgi:hypothetical protein
MTTQFGLDYTTTPDAIDFTLSLLTEAGKTLVFSGKYIAFADNRINFHDMINNVLKSINGDKNFSYSNEKTGATWFRRG